MTMSPVRVQRPDKLDNICAENFKSRKRFLSLKTYIFPELNLE